MKIGKFYIPQFVVIVFLLGLLALSFIPAGQMAYRWFTGEETPPWGGSTYQVPEYAVEGWDSIESIRQLPEYPVVHTTRQNTTGDWEKTPSLPMYVWSFGSEVMLDNDQVLVIAGGLDPYHGSYLVYDKNEGWLGIATSMSFIYPYFQTEEVNQ